jgi:transporter family-2 protein
MNATRKLPPWLALGLAALAGVAGAAQFAANAELGERLGSASTAAFVNNVVGTLLILAGLVVLPSLRADLRALFHTRLPWWTYLGGLGGAFLVAVAAYVVPVIGVAVFAIAQVAGAAFGGLGVDRAGLAPGGRLPVSTPRLGGAALGVGAVALAQFGRPVGDLAVGFLTLAVASGVAAALQSALNARVAAASNSAAATMTNFAVANATLLAFVAATGSFGAHWPTEWPREWYLYVGGLLGLLIVSALVVCVRAVGVLRTNLALVAGQLGGAVVLDAILPGRADPSAAVLVGVALTVVAASLSGWRRTPARADDRP